VMRKKPEIRNRGTQLDSPIFAGHLPVDWKHSFPVRFSIFLMLYISMFV